MSFGEKLLEGLLSEKYYDHIYTIPPFALGMTTFALLFFGLMMQYIFLFLWAIPFWIIWFIVIIYVFVQKKEFLYRKGLNHFFSPFRIYDVDSTNDVGDSLAFNKINNNEIPISIRDRLILGIQVISSKVHTKKMLKSELESDLKYFELMKNRYKRDAIDYKKDLKENLIDNFKKKDVNAEINKLEILTKQMEKETANTLERITEIDSEIVEIKRKTDYYKLLKQSKTDIKPEDLFKIEEIDAVAKYREAMVKLNKKINAKQSLLKALQGNLLSLDDLKKVKKIKADKKTEEKKTEEKKTEEKKKEKEKSEREEKIKESLRQNVVQIISPKIFFKRRNIIKNINAEQRELSELEARKERYDMIVEDLDKKDSISLLDVNTYDLIHSQELENIVRSIAILQKAMIYSYTFLKIKLERSLVYDLEEVKDMLLILPDDFDKTFDFGPGQALYGEVPLDVNQRTTVVGYELFEYDKVPIIFIGHSTWHVRRSGFVDFKNQAIDLNSIKINATVSLMAAKTTEIIEDYQNAIIQNRTLKRKNKKKLDLLLEQELQHVSELDKVAKASEFKKEYIPLTQNPIVYALIITNCVFLGLFILTIFGVL